VKTHLLAKSLSELARVLRKLPNVELNELQDVVNTSRSSAHPEDDVAVSLDALVGLARVDKQRWHDFIKDHRFPIEVRPRDASRDILGKLLKYLESNPRALQKLKARSKRRMEPSSELLQAFETLLRERP